MANFYKSSKIPVSLDFVIANAVRNNHFFLVPHCASSQKILAHWQQCKRDDCPLKGQMPNSVAHASNSQKSLINTVTSGSATVGSNPTQSKCYFYQQLFFLLFS